MLKLTQKQIKECLNFDGVIDITNMSNKEIQEIKQKEGYFNEYAYSQGLYGCNGCVLQGHKTLTFYVITKRSSALFSI